MNDDIFVAKDDIDGVLTVLGNEYYLDGRTFVVQHNNYHSHGIHLSGDEYNERIASFPSFNDASIVYNLACQCDTLSEVRRVVKHKELELDVANEWVVYLLHFNRKVGEPRQASDYMPHAGHYLGATGNLHRRLREQARGYSSAANIVKYLLKLGGSFEVANLWRCNTQEEAFNLERRYKRWKNSPKLCSICNWERRVNNGQGS